MHIKSAKYVTDYKIWVAFDDGTSGEVDLGGELHGLVFEAMKDIAIFSKVSVNPELETVMWPNGADLAPEFLKGIQNKKNQSKPSAQLI